MKIPPSEGFATTVGAASGTPSTANMAHFLRSDFLYPKGFFYLGDDPGY